MNLFLLAHGLGDYIFQSDTLVSMKKDGNPRGYAIHFLVILLFNLAVILPILSWHSVLTAFIIAAAHIFIDYARYIFFKSDNAYLFIIDQCAHIAVIYGATLLFSIPSYSPVYINCAVIFVYVVFGGALLIRHVLDMLRLQSSQYKVKNAGRIIGILERSIMLILVAIGETSAIGFVIAAKSIARFKELDDKEFAEYYLIGSLMSMLLALTGGLAIQGRL